MLWINIRPQRLNDRIRYSTRGFEYWSSKVDQMICRFTTATRIAANYSRQVYCVCYSQRKAAKGQIRSVISLHHILSTHRRHGSAWSNVTRNKIKKARKRTKKCPASSLRKPKAETFSNLDESMRTSTVHTYELLFRRLRNLWWISIEHIPQKHRWARTKQQIASCFFFWAIAKSASW